jgi:hypothetical protein
VKRGDRRLGRSGSGMRKAGTFKAHGPSKPSSSSSIEAWLKLNASLVGLGEKLGTDPHIGRPT